MNQQLYLALSDPQTIADNARKYLAPLGFSERETAVLLTLICHGQRCERAGQNFCSMQRPKSRLRALSGVSGTTFISGARDLENRGIVGIVQVVTPWMYVLNLDRLAKIDKPPPDPLEGLSVLNADWSPDKGRSTPVNAGQPLRDSVNEKTCKVRVPCTVNVSRDTQPLTGADRRWSRPWDRQGGCTDEELVRAVVGPELAALRELYDEAVRLGWIEDCEDAKVRFLTITHHSATCSGLHTRMGTLVARVKRGLDVGKIRHQSEDWAAAVLRRRHRDPDLACSREESVR
jgi:hypothetical protein